MLGQNTHRSALVERPEEHFPIVSVHQKAAVLLIDDESSTLGTLLEILERVGYVCCCCATADAACANAQSFAPDLIIAATNLFGASGVALCERLQQLDGLTDTPIMYLSRNQVPDIIRRGHLSGASYHLRKPFDPEVLLELVGKALMANRFHPPALRN